LRVTSYFHGVRLGEVGNVVRDAAAPLLHVDRVRRRTSRRPNVSVVMALGDSSRSVGYLLSSRTVEHLGCAVRQKDHSIHGEHDSEGLEGRHVVLLLVTIPL
jgi:hypothetical protein